MSDPRRMETSRHLRRQVALVGAGLADLLEATGVERLGPIENAAAFLQSMKKAAETEGGDVAGGDQPIDRLISKLALSEPEERTLLLLAGMPEEHEGYGTILRALHPRGEPRPTVGLAAQLLARESNQRAELRALVETGALIRSGAVALTGDAPFFERSLVPLEGLWAALHGLDVWPRGLRPLQMSASSTGLRGWLNTAPVTLARRALESNEQRLVLITADSEEIALHRAILLGREAGVSTVAINAWTGDRPDLEQAASIHALVRGAVPIVRMGGNEPAGTLPSIPDLGGFAGPIVVAARRGAVRIQSGRPVVHIDAERPSVGDRQRVWEDILPELNSKAGELATSYTLDPAQIADVARDVRSFKALEPGGVTPESLAASVRVRSNLALAAGFELRRATADWKALVLPGDREAQMREALARLRHQGRVLDEWGFLKDRPGARGVRMLFSGPPGTGKTLAAEVLAADLKVDLLAVDIPRVVSKWIGETEKNLAEVFDAAERAQAVLFFDEADAFFGRRTEISDAHDRYANFETAYLLSRLERFEGLAILATNLRQNIDPAFLRRLEFVIEFDEPAAAERTRIWECHLPKKTITLADDVKLGEIAGLYAIVGGLIRNAAVAAAFLAAGEGSTEIARRHFLHAIAREYEKTGKAFPGVPAGAGV
jgi:ATPase family associated with various cellular activities (AAA)